MLFCRLGGIMPPSPFYPVRNKIMTNSTSPVKRTRHRRGDRRFRVQRLANLLPKEARRVFRQFGFAESAIITRWHEVVGAELSRHSMPLSLKFQRGKRVGGTLHIRVDGPIATELQHLEPVLVEKINTFYGYSAVGKIAIEQGPISPHATRAPRAKTHIDPEAEVEVQNLVDDTHDEALKEALEALGRTVYSEPEK